MLTEPITAGLWRDFLYTVKDGKFDPTELRLSESGGCQRKRVLAALQAPPTHQETDENLGILQAGHILEAQVVALYKAKYGGRRIITQREIKLPQYGASGHIDIWIPSLPLGVECKSTKIGARDNLPNDGHLAQVQAYLHFYGVPHGCDTWELAYIFRETLEMEVFTIRYRPEIGRQIEMELSQLNARIQRGRLDLASGWTFEQLLDDPLHMVVPEVPDYAGPQAFPCYYRTKEYEVFCPFYGYCHNADLSMFAADALEVPELAEVLTSLRDARAIYQERKQQADEAKAMVDALEATVHKVCDQASQNEVTAGGVTFSRSYVKGTVGYQVNKAIKSGILSDEVLELLEPYKKESAGYWRTTVK